MLFPTVISFQRDWQIVRECESPPEGASVELIRFATGKNLAFRGLIHYCDPTTVCDPNGCLSSVFPVTLDERTRRQIIQRLPAWRTAPAVLSAPSHNLTTHVGTSFQIRATRQQTPHVRSDCAEHVWVSMKADRIDQWRFSVVAVSDDVLAKEARGLMPMPDDDHVAVQRIPSSDLPMLASRAVDGMRPSLGNHP